MRKTKKKQTKKKPTIPELKKKLWTEFSIYIRLRDADDDGYCYCISCGKPMLWKGTGECQAGHYFPKGSDYSSIYFDEDNNHAQCLHCNKFLEGNTHEYRKGLLGKIGEERLQRLDNIKRDGLNWTVEDYKEKIKYYKEANKKLSKHKGLQL